LLNIGRFEREENKSVNVSEITLALEVRIEKNKDFINILLLNNLTLKIKRLNSKLQIDNRILFSINCGLAKQKLKLRLN